MFSGGPIHPMAADSPPGRLVEAVVIEGDRIVAVGSLDDCVAAAPPGSERFDLAGSTMLPGFVDAHTHPLMLGQCLSWADLSTASSVDEVVKLLADHLDRSDTADDPNGPLAAVRGFGYDHNRLDGAAHPTALDLDRVSTTLPVEIMHASGHGYVVNTASLNAAGIDRATPTPPGGRIDHHPDGTPTGLIFDAACDLLTGTDGVKISNHGPNLHLPEPNDVLDQMLDLGMATLSRAGITSTCDCQVTEREMTAWLRARQSGRLVLRASMMVLSSHIEHLEGLGFSSAFGDDWLQLGGVKLYADGALTSGTAYVPCGCPVNHRGGYLFHTPDEYQDLLIRAHRLGLQTGTHAQGPIPIGMVLAAIQAAHDISPRHDVRHRIEHCGFPTDAQIEQMAALGVVPVPQSTQVHQYGDGALREYGDIAERMYPLGLFERAGIDVVVSSDAPVTMPDVFLALWTAVTRRASSGRVIGPECALDVGAALKGYTINAARAMHREDAVGSIEPGKLADLVIVDADPLAVETDALPDIDVEQTWVGGSMQ